MIKIVVSNVDREGNEKHMGTAIITSDGTGNQDIGNFRAKFSKWNDPEEIWKYGRVINFPRRSRGTWDLVFLALDSCVGYRNVYREGRQFVPPDMSTYAVFDNREGEANLAEVHAE